MENGPHAVVPRPSVRKKPPARLHLCSQSRPLLSPDRRIPRPLYPHRRTGPNAAHPAPDRPDLREKAGHTPLQASPPQPPPAAAPRLPRPARLEHQRPARAFLPCTSGTARMDLNGVPGVWLPSLHRRDGQPFSFPSRTTRSRTGRNLARSWNPLQPR